jgi:hypothetical protein
MSEQPALTENDSAENIVRSFARAELDKLTTQQLVSFNMAMSAGWSVKQRSGYKQIEHLFTEKDGEAFHSLIEEEFQALLAERLA